MAEFSGSPSAPQTQSDASFWQGPFAQRVLPLVSSLILHASLIALGILAVHVTKFAFLPRIVPQTTVPDMPEIVDNPNAVIPGNPGQHDDPTHRAGQLKYLDVPPGGWADDPGENRFPVPRLIAGDSSNEPDVVAIGGTGVSGWTPSGGRRTNGGLDGGPLAPFGNPGGDLRAGFYPERGKPLDRARRIVYVCDASGSMLNTFDSLRTELRKSIDGLRAVQSFNVIFFQNQNYSTIDKSGLVPAVPANKRRAYDFLDNSCVGGQTDPIAALELAFAQKPELIFLLTDGDFSGSGNDAVVAFCKQRAGGVKINTIAFLGKDRQDPQQLSFVRALETIAKNSGGRFRYVTQDDM